MEFLDRFILHDSRLLTEVIQEPIVDVVITSPPYWNLKDYSAPAQIGFGQTKGEYLRDLERVLSNCFQVTKETGSLWLVVDTFRLDGELHMLPWEIAEKAKMVGWQLKELIIWDKQHNVPWQKKGQMRHVTEFILFFSKGPKFNFYIDRIKELDGLSKWWADFPERFNPKGKTPSNIWEIPVRVRGTWPKPSEINHHCPFPTALVSRIIELTTDPGDLVLDPFGGSGVVLAQAEVMERHFIGFDVNSDYIKLFYNVVKQKVKEEWIEIQQWRNTNANSIKDFEQTILRLRSLKYAWHVIKASIGELSLEDYDNIRGLVCVASLPSEFQREKPFLVEIFIIVNTRNSNNEAMINTIKKHSVKSPLTHYGITSNITLLTTDEASQDKRFSKQMFYLYRTSKFRKPSASLSLGEWMNMDNNSRNINEKSRMYILANIDIDLSFIQNN